MNDDDLERIESDNEGCLYEMTTAAKKHSDDKIKMRNTFSTNLKWDLNKSVAKNSKPAAKK